MTEYTVYLNRGGTNFIRYNSENANLQPLVNLLNEHYAEYAACFYGDGDKFALAVGGRKFFEKLLNNPPFKIRGWYSTGRNLVSFDYGIKIPQEEGLPKFDFNSKNIKLLHSDKVIVMH